jgi:hypothetical protein
MHTSTTSHSQKASLNAGEARITEDPSPSKEPLSYLRTSTPCASIDSNPTLDRGYPRMLGTIAGIWTCAVLIWLHLICLGCQTCDDIKLPAEMRDSPILEKILRQGRAVMAECLLKSVLTMRWW